MNRRRKPYVWVSWITGLLAGTDKCYYRPWVKSQFYVPKAEEDADSAARLKAWNEEHDRMVQARAVRLKAEGYNVRVEAENKFFLEGAKATLSGQADLIGLREAQKRALIVDEKSGKVKDQYIWQVILYMFAFSNLNLKGWVIDGEVEYKGSQVAVPERQLSVVNKDRIFKVMQVMGDPTEPPRAPSEAECKYCDVLGCPDRYQAPPAQSADVSNFF